MKETSESFNFLHEVHSLTRKKSIATIQGILKELISSIDDCLHIHRRRFHIRNQDRVIMENDIFPALTNLSEGTKILSIGVRWYATHYEQYFVKSNISYITCEIDSTVACFGSAVGHITSDFLNVSNIVGKSVYDVVLMQGVFGHGLNTEEKFRSGLKTCQDILKDGGILLIGWDWGTSIEPSEKNIDIVKQYFNPLDEFQGLPFHISAGNHEFHWFQKK